MARLILADSDVLIDAMHGIEPALSRVAEMLVAGTLATSAVTVFELCVGVRSVREQAALDGLLGPLTVLPLDDAVARLAAEVEKDLRRRGVRVGYADALIAGTCLAADAPLLTRNARHFGRVQGLRIEPLGSATP